MALVPAFVTRSISVVGETKNTYKVSRLFTAVFADGSKKRLHSLDSTPKGLLLANQVGIENEVVITDSPLCVRDWSQVKEYKNNFKKEYPKKIEKQFSIDGEGSFSIDELTDQNDGFDFSELKSWTIGQEEFFHICLIKRVA